MLALCVGVTLGWLSGGASLASAAPTTSSTDDQRVEPSPATSWKPVLVSPGDSTSTSMALALSSAARASPHIARNALVPPYTA